MTDHPVNAKMKEDFANVLVAHGYSPEISGRLIRLAAVLAEPTPFQNALLRSAVNEKLEIKEIERLLRLAEYPPSLVRLLIKLLELYSDPAPNDKPSINDVTSLIDNAITYSALDPEFIRGFKEIIRKQDDLSRFRELVRISRSATLVEDGCISIAESSWQHDPAYERAYAAAKDISAWGREIHWRVYILAKVAAIGARLEGDFVECGVDRGGTAMAVMTYLGDDNFTGRNFYLFDTYRGLVQEQLTEEEKGTSLIRETRYTDSLSHVQNTFADRPFVKVVPGAVPHTLAEYKGDRVAYLHIDMNVSLPELEALKFFWPKLSSGAPVIFDDYGFKQHQPQRVALDQLAAEFGVEIIMLPTCQGLLIKP